MSRAAVIPLYDTKDPLRSLGITLLHIFLLDSSALTRCGYQSLISLNPYLHVGFPFPGSNFTLGLRADQMLNPVIYYGAWQN